MHGYSPCHPVVGGRLGKRTRGSRGGAAWPGERVNDRVCGLPAGVCCQAPVSKTHSMGLSEAFIRPSSQLITERVIAAPPPEALSKNKACFCPAPARQLTEEKLLPARGWLGSTGASIPGTSIPGTSILGTSIPGASIPGTSILGTSIPSMNIPGTQPPLPTSSMGVNVATSAPTSAEELALREQFWGSFRKFGVGKRTSEGSITDTRDSRCCCLLCRAGLPFAALLVTNEPLTRLLKGAKPPRCWSSSLCHQPNDKTSCKPDFSPIAGPGLPLTASHPLHWTQRLLSHPQLFLLCCSRVTPVLVFPEDESGHMRS